MARVFFGPQLREATGGAAAVDVDGADLRQVIRSLEAKFPQLRKRLRQGERIATGLAVDIDGSIATMGLLTPVSSASEIHFLPAISGGS